MATRTWNGGGINDNLFAPANWVGGVAPLSGDDVVFAGVIRLTPFNNLGNGFNFNSITFSAGSGAFVLTGDDIDLDGAITNNDGSSQRIDCNINLTGQRTINCVNGRIRLGGIISGTGGITKEGATSGDDLHFDSAGNTYSGPTIINGAEVENDAINAMSPNSAIVLADVAGCMLKLDFPCIIGSFTGGGASGGNVVLNANTLTVGDDDTSPAALAGIISGTGGVVKIGTGELALSGVNTYTGTTTINAGSYGPIDSGSIAVGSTVTVNSGGTLMGDGDVLGSVIINNNGTISPGDAGPGALIIDLNLVLNSTAKMDYDLGISSDTIDSVNDLTLDGVINVSNSGGFDAGTFLLITYSGILTNNTLIVGALPHGFSAIVVTNATQVNLVVTTDLINLTGNLKSNLLGGFQT